MENEQCGLCWDLKYDNRGKATHVSGYHPHDFVPFDFCLKCKKPQYDQFGIPTHFIDIDLSKDQEKKNSHKFCSALKRKSKEKTRRKRIAIALIGVISFGFSIGIINLIL